MDEWQPVSMVDEPTDLDEATLDSVPTIQGPNGLKVKIHPNGKTVGYDGNARLASAQISGYG